MIQMKMCEHHCIQRPHGNSGLIQAQKSTGSTVEEQRLAVLHQNSRLGAAGLGDADASAKQRDFKAHFSSISDSMVNNGIHGRFLQIKDKK